MPRKLKLDFIKKEFEKEGYKLLTKEYINSQQKLDYICPGGHKHYIRWNRFQQGARCFYCYGKIKKTIEFIKSEFEKEKYILLSTEYKNCFGKLDYICPAGHKNKIKWSDWQQNVRCSTCHNLNRFGSGNPNYGNGAKIKGKNNPFYNKKHSKESKEKISKSNKGENNSNYGRRGVDASGYKHGLSRTRAYANQQHMKRQALKRNQTPADADTEKIIYIYQVCSSMNKLSNLKYEVDHIIPLSKGGLHHQDNLQILPGYLNNKKRAKLSCVYRGITLRQLEKGGIFL